MLDSLRDRVLRRIARFGVPVALGKLAQSLAGLGTLSLLARHLGPLLFGAVALIRTTGTVISLYADFNTWQAIVRYGTEAMARGNKDDVKRIVKISYIVDFVTSVLAAIIMVGLAVFVPRAFGLDHAGAVGFALYGVSLVVRMGGTDGVYRIFDAYRAQAIITSTAALITVAAVAVAVLMNASFSWCLFAVGLSEAVGFVLIYVGACWVQHQAGYGGWLRISLRGARTTFPGIIRFLLSTNGQLTVKKTQGELDMFVVGGMLGQADAGLLRVVKQISTIPQRVFMPFEQVLFTELARHAAAGDYPGFRTTLRRFSNVVAIGGLALWALGAAGATLIVRLVAGKEFIAAAPLLTWYLLAMAVATIAAPAQRAIIALGRPGTLFWFELGSLALFIGGASIGAYVWGLTGVGAAVLAHKLVQLTWSRVIVHRIAQDLSQQKTPPVAGLAYSPE